MDHLHYVVAAYALTFGVMTTVGLKVWTTGQCYRRQVKALAIVRRRLPNEDR
jgi:hypothetical protein